MRPPWTLEELEALRVRLRLELGDIEEQLAHARALPPLSRDETLGLLSAFFQRASERPLTNEECFLGGQLLSSFEMAIRAEALGKPPGRYYVISETDLERLRRAPGASPVDGTEP